MSRKACPALGSHHLPVLFLPGSVLFIATLALHWKPSQEPGTNLQNLRPGAGVPLVFRSAPRALFRVMPCSPGQHSLPGVRSWALSCSGLLGFHPALFILKVN